MTRDLSPELLQATQRGLQRAFTKLYEAVDLGAWATLFTRVTSNAAGENYPAFGAAPGMAKFEGSRVYGSVRTDGFFVMNEEYDAALAIPRADIERDRLGVYDGKLQEMATNAKLYVITLLSAILADPTSTTLAKCWDDAALASASHGKGKAAQSNILTGSGVATVDQVQTDVAQAVSKLATLKDDKGNYLRANVPNIAIVPAANYGLIKILETIQANRGALGTPDQSRIIQDILPVPEMTGNDWALCVGGGGMRPFGFQEEKPPTPETTYDFDTKTMKMAVEMRGAAFCMDWTKFVWVNNS